MMLVVLLASLIMTIAATVTPSIETDSDGNVLVTIPASADLKVIKVDEVSGEATEGKLTRMFFSK